MLDMNARSLTDADRAAACRLKTIWMRRQTDSRRTQEQAAQDLGITPGAVSQYLNGRLALGVTATLRWANYLGVSPEEIRPDLGEMVGSNTSLQGDIDVEKLERALYDVDRMIQRRGMQMELKKKSRLTASLYKYLYSRAEAVEVTDDQFDLFIRLLG